MCIVVFWLFVWVFLCLSFRFSRAFRHVSVLRCPVFCSYMYSYVYTDAYDGAEGELFSGGGSAPSSSSERESEKQTPIPKATIALKVVVMHINSLTEHKHTVTVWSAFSLKQHSEMNTHSTHLQYFSTNTQNIKSQYHSMYSALIRWDTVILCLHNATKHNK